MKFRKYLLFLVIAALAVVVAACGRVQSSKKVKKTRQMQL